MAFSFYEHHPQGASTPTWKMLNSQGLLCSALVNEWTGILLKIEHTNQTVWNEAMIIRKSTRYAKILW